MNKRVVMIRTEDNGKQTASSAFAFDGTRKVFEFSTLEPPWKNNEVKKSCIRAGRYKVVRRYSARFKDHFIILNTEGRDLVLFHIGNFMGSLNPKTEKPDSEGCVLSGMGFADIDKDGNPDLVSSRTAHERLLQWAPEGFILDVIDTLEVKTTLS